VTQNECDRAERLGAQFRFCFVSLHPDSLGYALLTLPELAARATGKRVQYQVNVGMGCRGAP
jgi:hypothetical protein